MDMCGYDHVTTTTTRPHMGGHAMSAKTQLAVMGLILAATATVCGETYYVNGTTGDDAWNGKCAVWDGDTCGPKATLRAAIDLAVAGDEIRVADGIYAGPGNRGLAINQAITLRSENGSAACTIDCEFADRAMTISAAARISGFTIRNGVATEGGALLISDAPIITDCIFRENVAESGGAIMVSGTPAIMHCIFAGNHATVMDGGGICNYGGNPRIINSLLVANTANLFGGAMFSDLAAFAMINCTLVHNTASRAGGIRNYAGVEMTLTNCILWGNSDDDGAGCSAQITSVSSSEIITYCCIAGCGGTFGGTGVIDADPLFVDPDGPDNDPTTWQNNDYHLSGKSPCIDAGLSFAITADLDGHQRVVDHPATPDTGFGFLDVIDMGVYEYSSVSRSSGDFDGDGDVDVDDFKLFQKQFSGPR